MFGNFSLPELLIVGALALIVIGPKDLPRMMRQVGRFVGQARGLARQFQDSMNDAAREADLEEFREARKLLKGKSGVKEMLDDTLDFEDDDEDDHKPAKPSNTVTPRDELAKRAAESGFGPKPEPEPNPATETTDTAAASPAATPDETPRTADAKSG